MPCEFYEIQLQISIYISCLVCQRHIEDHHCHNDIHYCTHQRHCPLYYIDNIQVDNCSILTSHSLTHHLLYDPSILPTVKLVHIQFTSP